MTTKDYIIVAKVLQTVRESYGINWNQNLFRALDDVTAELCRVMEKGNPKFKVAMFIAATQRRAGK